jgi:transposase-like protein
MGPLCGLATGVGRGVYRTFTLNNIIEQDHRFIKKRIAASLGFRSAEGAWRTIEGYEAMHLIRKGQIRWLAKGDVVGQRQFIHSLFGIAA